MLGIVIRGNQDQARLRLLLLDFARQVGKDAVLQVGIQDEQRKDGPSGAAACFGAGLRQAHAVLAAFLEAEAQQFTKGKMWAGDENLFGHVKSVSRA